MRDEDTARRALGQTAGRRACQGCGRVVDWCGGRHVTWGSCETREEAIFEAGWILANVPEAARVAIDEVTRYEIDRDGLAGGDSVFPALAASVAASVREARGRTAA